MLAELIRPQEPHREPLARTSPVPKGTQAKSALSACTGVPGVRPAPRLDHGSLVKQETGNLATRNKNGLTSHSLLGPGLRFPGQLSPDRCLSPHECVYTSSSQRDLLASSMLLGDTLGLFRPHRLRCQEVSSFPWRPQSPGLRRRSVLYPLPTSSYSPLLSSLLSPSLSLGMKWNRTKSPTQSNSDSSFCWKHYFGHFPQEMQLPSLFCVAYLQLICIHSEGRIHMYILCFTESAML